MQLLLQRMNISLNIMELFQRLSIRASLGNFIGLGSSSGGSTLTQQLIKQQVVGDAPTLARKANEIVNALALERAMSRRKS